MVKEQGDDRECPVDREELGRATWTFLHTTAAYYPDHASAHQQQEMTQLLRALSNFYPCDDCAHHLRAWYDTSLSEYLKLHNFVYKQTCTLHVPPLS